MRDRSAEKLKKMALSVSTGTLAINPFVSEAQRAWMHIHHPDMAKKWEAHTPKGKGLPKYKRKGKKKLTSNKGRNLLRLDPTRTGHLRRKMLSEIRRRFASMKGIIVKLVVMDDAFGLGKVSN